VIVDTDETKKKQTIASCDEESGCILTLSSDTAPTSKEQGLQQSNNEQQQQQNAQLDNYDDDEASCMICLEPYLIGDKVSYSKHNALQCRHIFHQECISDWLMRQDDCPCCRTPFIMQPGADGSNINEQTLNDQTDIQNAEDLDLEQSDEDSSQDHARPSGVLYIVNGMISKNMYSMFSVTDEKEEDNNEQEKSATTDIEEANSPLFETENTTSQSEEDSRQEDSTPRRRSLVERVFGRAYTSVSINDDEDDRTDDDDMQQSEERRDRIEQINDDNRDDNEVHEIQYNAF